MEESGIWKIWIRLISDTTKKINWETPKVGIVSSTVTSKISLNNVEK